MANQSAIEWTDITWNPVTGCDRVSPGCAHCYALDLAERLKRKEQGRIEKARREGKPDPKVRYQRDGDPKTSGPGFGLTLHPDKLEEPLRWRKPRRVFVNSMSDLFHEEIPDEYIYRVFDVMARSSQHTFQVLTKRPERMRDHLHMWAIARDDARIVAPEWPAFPLPNVWLGVSIENRRFVHRADLLRETPAAVRFISAEPLLGPLVYDGDDEVDVDGTLIGYWSDGAVGPELDLTDIDWLIVGGESGPKRRQIEESWVRGLRDASRSCDPEPAFFFKQWGGRTPKAGGRELDGRTWDEFPAAAREQVA